MESDSNDKLFRAAAVSVIIRRQQLSLRLLPARLHLRFEQDPQLTAGKFEHLKREDLAFQSSARLLDGSALMQTYVTPLQGALTPAVWCFSHLGRSGR